MPPAQEQIPFSLDQLPQDTDFGISPVPGPTDDLIGQLPDLSGVQYASLNNGIQSDAGGGSYEVAPNPSAENIYNYINQYGSDNLDTGSNGIDLGNSGVTYIADPSSYLSSGSYDTGGYDLNASIGSAGSINMGWESGGGGGGGGIGGGSGETMMLVATGGRINSHVKEALKRTRKFAKGGSVTNNARMILSKRA
jgi:hypothetical protein